MLCDQPYAVVEKNGRKKRLEIPLWATGIEKSICAIMRSSDAMVRKIIDLLYYKGFKDYEIYITLPISESGYYRIKRRLEDKIFDLCIVYGYVDEEEIISNTI